MYKIIDDYLTNEELNIIEKYWPNENDTCWYKRTDLFQKNQFGCNNKDKIPKKLLKIINKFQSNDFVNFVSSTLGIKNLKKDNQLHGGGIVQYGKDGYLDLHLDYDIHPLTKKHRRANILLYLTKDWKEEYNGALKLYDGELLIDTIYPKYNRLVIFSVDDNSWHGFPEPLKCPNNIFRKSINVYYVTESIKKTCDRPRAYFVPGPPKNNSFENIKNWSKEDFEIRDSYIKNIQIKQYKK